MARTLSGFVHQAKIETGLARASSALAPDVVHIRYSIREDWSGSEALFFRVLLSNRASRPKHLREVTKRVDATVYNEVRPDELGLEAYFNYRSVSEQAELKEPIWA